VTNDLVAFTKGIAKRRGRNEAWAEKAVRESVSATADEALEKKIVDIIAKDIDDLIHQMNHRSIEGKGKLELDNVQFTRIEESLRTKVLKLISDPNIVYILMLIGMAGLYFELSNPGAVLPGVIGAIALILALFAFQTLPVNAAGILLIALAVVFFILEIKVTSYGLLSLAGVVSFVLGSMMLFKGAGPGYQLAWKVVLPSVFAISAFFIVVASLAVRAHTHRVQTGSEGLIGEVGVVRSVNDQYGKVQVHGELWQAEFKTPVQVGEKVRVTLVKNLVITVEPIEPKTS
jgi:membrane-bound serine protease (ClpP class)